MVKAEEHKPAPAVMGEFVNASWAAPTVKKTLESGTAFPQPLELQLPSGYAATAHWPAALGVSVSLACPLDAVLLNAKMDPFGAIQTICSVRLPRPVAPAQTLWP